MSEEQAPGLSAGLVVLDPVALAKLRELDPDGQHGVVERVMAAFQGSLQRMLAQLAAEAARGDGADLVVVAGLAHTLKSSSASVGALELSRSCAEVERRLRHDGPGSLPEDITRLQDAARAALAAVEAMLRH